MKIMKFVPLIMIMNLKIFLLNEEDRESNIICAEQARIFATSFYAPILIHGTNQTNWTGIGVFKESWLKRFFQGRESKWKTKTALICFMKLSFIIFRSYSDLIHFHLSFSFSRENIISAKDWWDSVETSHENTDSRSSVSCDSSFRFKVVIERDSGKFTIIGLST